MTLLDPVDGAIRELVHRYAAAVVHRDAAAWGSCWAPDASWDLGRGRAVHGREAIVELWRSAMGTMAAVVQMVHNGAVHAAGEPGRASGRWYVDERFRSTTGEDGILLAHDDDRYVRGDDGGWRFAERTLRPHCTGVADLSGTSLNTRDGLTAAGGTAQV